MLIDDIKDRLSKAIHFCGMKHKDIAKKLGVPTSWINQYHNKKKLPRLDTLVQLCIIIDETPNYILGYENY